MIGKPPPDTNSQPNTKLKWLEAQGWTITIHKVGGEFHVMLTRGNIRRACSHRLRSQAVTDAFESVLEQPNAGATR